MKCFFCGRSITGADLKRRVEWRTTEDGLRTFGPGQPDGNLSEAYGSLERVFHHKCELAYIRRQALLAAKDADPPGARDDPDWHEQEVRDVQELMGEGDRDSGGAGAQNP